MSHPAPSGRDKLATLRAAEARQAKQRKLLALLAALVAVIVAVVAVMWAVSSNNSSNAKKASEGTAFIKTVETVPAATFDKIGVGTATNFPKTVNGATALTKDGKPRVVYFGGEFCPYCAMERWSIVSALSRFGTFSGLGSLVSSEANIPTMDFKNAKYTSKYVDFTPYETMDQNHQPLQTPSKADQAYFSKYDTSTYMGGSPQNDGAIPFMTFGGTSATAGSTFDASQDMVNKSTEEIAKALSDTGATTTKGIIGGANVISAQICQLTKNQPANVCSSAGVKAAAAKLGTK